MGDNTKKPLIKIWFSYLDIEILIGLNILIFEIWAQNKNFENS